MHFQIVSMSDLALISESVTITRNIIHPSLEAYEAEHVGAGRLLVTVDPISGSATVASERPLDRHFVLYGAKQAA